MTWLVLSVLVLTGSAASGFRFISAWRENIDEWPWLLSSTADQGVDLSRVTDQCQSVPVIHSRTGGQSLISFYTLSTLTALGDFCSLHSHTHLLKGWINDLISLIAYDDFCSCKKSRGRTCHPMNPWPLTVQYIFSSWKVNKMHKIQCTT